MRQRGDGDALLTALCCLGAGSYRLDGIERMRQRPIGELVEQLRVLGCEVTCEGKEGFPPLRVEGNPLELESNRLKIGTTLSSQYVSALLQIGPFLPEGLEVEMVGEEITSLPYLKMTLKLMRRFRVKSEAHRGYRAIIVPKKRYKAQTIDIEPDASNASYFLAAASVVPGSSAAPWRGWARNSVQGDMRFCELLGRMGCEVDQRLDRDHRVDARRRAAAEVGSPSTSTRCRTWPRPWPSSRFSRRGRRPSATSATFASRRPTGWKRCAWSSPSSEPTVNVVGDDLTVTPAGRKPDDDARGSIDTYDDHRMAMAFAVAGLAQPGVTINDPACVNKTFPSFFEKLATLRS